MEMKRKIVCVLVAMIVGGTCAIHAQNELLDVQNGKAVRHIAFDLEQVTVSYKDGSQEENVQEGLYVSTSETTGISETAATVPGNSAVEVYDLQGRRISQSSMPKSQHVRGICIVKNGNKTTIRINK